MLTPLKRMSFFRVEAPNFVPWPGVKFSGETLGLLYFSLTCTFQSEKGLQKNKSRGRLSRKSRFSKNSRANQPFSTWPRPTVPSLLPQTPLVPSERHSQTNLPVILNADLGVASAPEV